ncbi:DUF2188 domain-containing protein [Pseudomonas viridiflava]|uniref:DUF2188 domain-containing protein n=1 Tax=Pseudomonas viridiflava TaxID=33069 RepID=UPI000F02D87E|nr:DUF2188 domain-containing protein [Pseudomonas viridiflava]MBV1813134.1 DUF2188 domain-containing protein [Pseudomonas viridiflava]MEE4130243.1 DUF2188 domain-containing protein [Pseudomonas viridiflava]
MSVPMLSKTQINGYQLISVNRGPWTVCTPKDRLASFNTRQKAMAYAASLPVRDWGRSRPA